MSRIGRDLALWERIYYAGDCTREQFREAARELGCDERHIAEVIGPEPAAMPRIESLISEARNLAILICPLPSQLDDGDAIERMPDDLLRAATMLGRLCELLENRNG